jgi:ribosomal protein S10
MLRDAKCLLLLLKNITQYRSKKILFLPSKIKKFSVVKSPFVSKLAKEQFEIKVYKVLITCYPNNTLFIRFVREKKFMKIKNVYYKLSFFYKSLSL